MYVYVLISSLTILFLSIVMPVKMAKADVYVIGERPEYKSNEHHCKAKLHSGDDSQRRFHKQWTSPRGETPVTCCDSTAKKKNKINSWSMFNILDIYGCGDPEYKKW